MDYESILSLLAVVALIWGVLKLKRRIVVGVVVMSVMILMTILSAMKIPAVMISAAMINPLV